MDRREADKAQSVQQTIQMDGVDLTSSIFDLKHSKAHRFVPHISDLLEFEEVPAQRVKGGKNISCLTRKKLRSNKWH